MSDKTITPARSTADSFPELELRLEQLSKIDTPQFRALPWLSPVEARAVVRRYLDGIEAQYGTGDHARACAMGGLAALFELALCGQISTAARVAVGE